MPLNGEGVYNDLLGHSNIQYYTHALRHPNYDGQNIVRYIDLNDDSADFTGIHANKYAIVNPDGTMTPITDVTDENTYSWAMDEYGKPVAHSFYNWTDRTPDNPYYDYYTATPKSAANASKHIAYINPLTGDVVLDIGNDPGVAAGLKIKDNEAISIPRDV